MKRNIALDVCNTSTNRGISPCAKPCHIFLLNPPPCKDGFRLFSIFAASDEELDCPTVAQAFSLRLLEILAKSGKMMVSELLMKNMVDYPVDLLKPATNDLRPKRQPWKWAFFNPYSSMKALMWSCFQYLQYRGHSKMVLNETWE